MDGMGRKRLAVLRSRYPQGCLVELVSMDGWHAVPKATKGTVVHVAPREPSTPQGKPARFWGWCRSSIWSRSWTSKIS